jgi:hypothetical protein
MNHHLAFDLQEDLRVIRPRHEQPLRIPIHPAPRLPPRLHTLFPGRSPSVLAREALILHLREHEKLRFREISKLLRLQGPDYVRTVYARACRHRRMMAASPSPQLLAEWRSLLLQAVFPGGVGAISLKDMTTRYGISYDTLTRMTGLGRTKRG